MPTDENSSAEAGLGGTTSAVESGSEHREAVTPQVEIGGGGIVLELPTRHTKILKLFESDVRTLERINRRAVAYFALSGFFLNIGIAIIVGFAFADPKSPLHPLGTLLWGFGPYVSFGLSLILFLLGIWEWLIKHGEVDDIYADHGLERKRFWRAANISRSKKLENSES